LALCLLLAAPELAVVVAGEPGLPAAATPTADAHSRAAATIRKQDVEAHLEILTGIPMEGRDSPSAGLEAAATYIASVFSEAGLLPATDAAEAIERVASPARPDAPADSPPPPSTDPLALMRRPFRVARPEPDFEGTYLALYDKDEEPAQGPGGLEFVDGKDFVPIHGCNGGGHGELVFVGYAISSSREKYDDLKGLELRGKVALIFSGEPRHRKRFAGPEVTPLASLWSKLAELSRRGVAGVLVMRRPADGVDPEQVPMAFRHTWAEWVGSPREQQPDDLPPTLEISPTCASILLERDAELLARRMDKNPRPIRLRLSGRSVDLASMTRERDLRLDNVVALVPGSDPTLAKEAVVIGAHYDHLGVGPRGRVGVGADDNGSGTAALLEVAQAMARAGPRRSVYFCAFAAEEDGLLGSAAFCEDPPLPASSMVAMVNMDMIGVGDSGEVVVLGLEQNPLLKVHLDRARKLSKTGVRRVRPIADRSLFRRSDHFSFHRIAVPTLFLFEGYPLEQNPDYHTWRDTLDKVDMEKVTRTARLAFNFAWILANADDRPPPPRE
jgi:hypothetical protein